MSSVKGMFIGVCAGLLQSFVERCKEQMPRVCVTHPLVHSQLFNKTKALPNIALPGVPIAA